MEPQQSDLSPESKTILERIKNLSPSERQTLIAVINNAFGSDVNHQDISFDISKESIAQDETPNKATLTPQAHLLSFFDLTDDRKPLSVQEREEFYLRVQETVKPEEYCLSWGFKPDRKRLGTPDKIYEIKHAFGTESDPHTDTCLVGYWFVWKNGSANELTAEIYRYPNKAILTDEMLIHLIAQVAPEWFGKQKPEEGFNSESGFTAPLNPGPTSKSPGHAQEIPVRSNEVALLVGETRVPAFV